MNEWLTIFYFIILFIFCLSGRLFSNFLLFHFILLYFLSTGKQEGTLFLGETEQTSDLKIDSESEKTNTPEILKKTQKIEEIARGAREGSRKLQNLSSEERSAVLMRIAEKLEEREKEILEVNLEDVDAAEKR